MATYSPQALGINTSGYGNGAWVQGRHLWNGTLSDPGVLHPESGQQGAGKAVSAEVNAQSAKAQGVSAPQFNNYLQQQSQAPQQAGGSVMGASTGGAIGGVGGGSGMGAPATIDLPSLYKNLYESSGIKAKQDELSAKEKQYIEATGGINDNPFLSEGTRVGRVAKMDELYQKRTANLNNEIATKKADIETQLNLQTKQFDINSQQAQIALQQFNSLLAAGALDNASGADIANVTRATGISSSMIQSAVQANKAKNLQTSVEKYDDGTNEGYRILTIDNAGNIVNMKSQVIGASQKGKQFNPQSFLDALQNQNQENVDLVQLWNSIPD